MALSKEEFIENLAILDIDFGDSIESVTLRDANIAFQKLAFYFASG